MSGLSTPISVECCLTGVSDQVRSHYPTALAVAFQVVHNRDKGRPHDGGFQRREKYTQTHPSPKFSIRRGTGKEYERYSKEMKLPPCKANLIVHIQRHRRPSVHGCISAGNGTGGPQWSIAAGHLIRIGHLSLVGACLFGVHVAVRIGAGKRQRIDGSLSRVAEASAGLYVGGKSTDDRRSYPWYRVGPGRPAASPSCSSHNPPASEYTAHCAEIDPFR